jgi:hypothetical protein
LQVVAVDRDAQVLPPNIRFVQFDLESGAPWPFRTERFGGIVVTNYLHRPLFGDIERSLAEDGVLIYETFMSGNERFGKPSNPNFLLRPGELLQAFGALKVRAFEQCTVQIPRPTVMQRLCAIAVHKG